MDLGRAPLARFPNGDVKLSDAPVTAEDLDFAIQKVCGPLKTQDSSTLQPGSLCMTSAKLEGKYLVR